MQSNKIFISCKRQKKGKSDDLPTGMTVNEQVSESAVPATEAVTVT